MRSGMEELINEIAKVGGAVLTVGLVTTIVGSRQSGQVIQAIGESFSMSIRAAQGIDAPPETQADKIARMEHEMMIAGHEVDCAICIEANRKKSLKERWLNRGR